MREECQVRPPSWQEGDSTARSYSRLGCSRLEAIPGKELFQAGSYTGQSGRQEGHSTPQGAILGWKLQPSWQELFQDGSYTVGRPTNNLDSLKEWTERL